MVIWEGSTKAKRLVTLINVEKGRFHFTTWSNLVKFSLHEWLLGGDFSWMQQAETEKRFKEFEIW